MRVKFINALKANQAAFNIDLPHEAIDGLADFYVLVHENNPLLHLVAPCSPEEFAVRHILESLTLLEHVPRRTTFADVGAGAGLPSIPCLLARDDLSALLIESKIKKADYLNETAIALGIEARVRIENRQFEEVVNTGFSTVTCRALDKFTEKLPRLVKWSRGRRLLLFGGPSLADALEKLRLPVIAKLLPMSDRRYLFITGRTYPGGPRKTTLK